MSNERGFRSNRESIPEFREWIKLARTGGENSDTAIDLVRSVLHNVIDKAGTASTDERVSDTPIGLLFALADAMCDFADEEYGDWESLQ
jgi:hypothetical protein